jgi:hypothetical protein
MIRAVGQFVGGRSDVGRRDLAKRLGISYHQLDYVLSKYRRLPKPKGKKKVAKSKKPKLAQVAIVDDPVSEVRPAGRAVELVLASGIRVSVGSTDQVVDLLETLERRSGRIRTAS